MSEFKSNEEYERWKAERILDIQSGKYRCQKQKIRGIPNDFLIGIENFLKTLKNSVLKHKCATIFLLFSTVMVAISAHHTLKYENNYSSKSIAEKLSIVDYRKLPPTTYQSLLDTIRSDCTGYSEERVGDLVAYAYKRLTEKGKQITTYEILTVLADAARDRLCSEQGFKLEDIIAINVVLKESGQ